jgi:hypothetical protein
MISVHLDQVKIHKIVIQTAVFIFSLLQTLSTAHIIDASPSMSIVNWVLKSATDGKQDWHVTMTDCFKKVIQGC